MRIINPGSVFQKIFRSPTLFLLFISLVLYFVYLNFKSLSFMLVLHDRLEKAKTEYASTQKQVTASQISTFENSTDEAKKRYKKEFFNTLEEGEYVVFLHKEQEELKTSEEIRKLTTWEKYSQKVKLWWKNK